MCNLIVITKYNVNLQGDALGELSYIIVAKTTYMYVLDQTSKSTIYGSFEQ